MVKAFQSQNIHKTFIRYVHATKMKFLLIQTNISRSDSLSLTAKNVKQHFSQVIFLKYFHTLQKQKTEDADKNAF